MNKHSPLIVFIVFICISSSAQIPNPSLVGYWQNWNDPNAPYIPLDQIDSRYNVVNISFAVPQAGTDYRMEFSPDQVSPATLITQIQNLQAQGQIVNISIGGAGLLISLDNISERDTFISTMNSIINTYGFDGIDIDLEGNSVSVLSGTISNPGDSKIINLIYAIKQIMSDYYSLHQKRLFLSMAPETAFVQGGMSAYGSIWGAYLPIIDALRDSIEILHVQLYNSGSMYGIDGNVYTQGTADFIVAMTEAAIRGFITSGGIFNGLAASKIAIGLPACSMAAGGGFTDTSIVKSALNYLMGRTPQPGSYSLSQTGGYPDLRGMMTWSINWDEVNSCGSSYQFADNFENIFYQTTYTKNPESQANNFGIYPNPATDIINLDYRQKNKSVFSYMIYNYLGESISSGTLGVSNNSVDISKLTAGIYTIQIENKTIKFIKE